MYIYLNTIYKLDPLGEEVTPLTRKEKEETSELEYVEVSKMEIGAQHISFYLADLFRIGVGKHLGCRMHHVYCNIPIQEVDPSPKAQNNLVQHN